MSIKDDYQQAVTLAQQGKFEDARSLLIAHDHPKTNALLDKVNAAIASNGTTKPKEKQVDLGVRFVSALIVFLVATSAALVAANAVYTARVSANPFGYVDAGFTELGFGLVIWVLLMFIGFRVSRQILQR